jgi:hypothetical protein
MSVDAPQEPLPVATVVSPPTPISGSIAATVFILIIGTIVGIVLAYIAAFIVVKVGLPSEKLFIALPLLGVGAIAWATTGKQRLRSGAITVITAGAIAAAVIAVWDPRSPSKLFTSTSKVTDVQVHGENATIALETTKRMTEMPPFGMTVGYAALLACFAVIVTTLGHGAQALGQRNKKPF